MDISLYYRFYGNAKLCLSCSFCILNSRRPCATLRNKILDKFNQRIHEQKFISELCYFLNKVFGVTIDVESSCRDGTKEYHTIGFEF